MVDIATSKAAESGSMLLLEAPSTRHFFAKSHEYTRHFEQWQSDRLFPLARIALLYSSIIFLLHQGLDLRGLDNFSSVRELFLVRLVVSVSLIVIVFLSFWITSPRGYELILYASVALLSVGSGYIAASFAGSEAVLMAITNILVGLVLVGLAPNLRSICIITLVFFIAPLGVLLTYSEGAIVNAVGWSNIGGLAITVVLLGAIIHYYRRVSFVAMATLDQAARHDALTGALSRRGLIEEIQIAMATYRRNEVPFSVLIMDLDHFKKVNDTYGHEAGDAVLRVFSNTCKVQLRAGDRFGRLGGEEFAVLLPGTQAQVAFNLAERLRKAIEQAATPFGREVIRITASGGIAEVEAADADQSDLLRRADQALYAAKRSGRNRMVVYESSVHAGDLSSSHHDLSTVA